MSCEPDGAGWTRAPKASPAWPLQQKAGAVEGTVGTPIALQVTGRGWPPELGGGDTLPRSVCGAGFSLLPPPCGPVTLQLRRTGLSPASWPSLSSHPLLSRGSQALVQALASSCPLWPILTPKPQESL